ncbi:MAG TPA: glycosyltransferase family 1 protein [Anaerolineales bacterium]|nr:glycosyltransferase family 1 protein [Anaerolineales bacterium]
MRESTRVILTLDFPPREGGISEWSFQVARSFVRLGERVVVFCRRKVLGSRTRYLREPFEVKPMFGRNWAGLKHLYLIYYTLKIRAKYHPAEIYATNWELGLIPSLLGAVLSLKVVLVAHGWEITRKGSRWRRRLERIALRRADRVVAVSRYTRGKVLEAGGRADRTQVVANGVDLTSFHPGPRPDDLVSRFGLRGKKVILTLARIVERKGHDKVIEALPEVLKAVPEAVYLIAGRGGYREKLEEIAEQCGVRDRVLLAGYVPDARRADFYNVSDVVAMPCRELADRGDVEGFGIVFLEAGACGKPVVGGRSGGVEDAIVDGETGFLVDPLNVHQIAERLIRLLTDEPLASAMGKRGRLRAEERSWDHVAEHMLRETRRVYV